MTAKTRLGYEGYGVRRAGSFAGKTITNVVTATLAATELPDIVSFVVSFIGTLWTPSTKQTEIWTADTKQDETWTPAVKQAETWTPE